ncbi:hypothetical protein D3C81_1680280 [compost metagenome]
MGNGSTDSASKRKEVGVLDASTGYPIGVRNMRISSKNRCGLARWGACQGRGLKRCLERQLIGHCRSEIRIVTQCRSQLV